MLNLGPNSTYHVLLFSKKMWYAIATKFEGGNRKGGEVGKMKMKRSQVLVKVWISCLVLSVFAGCGHGQKEGEKYEVQSNMEETGQSLYEISDSGNGSTEWSKKTTDDESTAENISTKPEEVESDSNGTSIDEYRSGETSAVVYFDDDSEKSQNQGESAGDTQNQEESNMSEPQEEQLQESRKQEEVQQESQPQEEQSAAMQPYFLTEADKEQVIEQLARMGESYGLKYYPNVEEGETWDSPTPIYEEELVMGQEYIMSTMVSYTEGAFVLMQMEGCPGFALQIKEYPNTVTDAYYEVYVYWM